MPCIEQLEWDVDDKRPELLISINRVKAKQLGLSSGQIGAALRTALFGKDVSKFRDKEDEYDIVLRLEEKYRNSITSLLDMRITFLDMADGQLKSIPISAVASFDYNEAYGGINRTDLEKSIKISSKVLTDYDVNQVFSDVEYYVDDYLKQGRSLSTVGIEVGGQTKDQEEQGAFLGGAFLIALVLIFMILVTQFNSFSNVIIILSQVILSVIGVFLGHVMLGLEFSVVLSGVGIVVLAGIVVNNGIILLDFIEAKRKEGLPLREAIIEGASTRFTPVLLTASSTVLGLVPLALSLNINFGTLLSDLDPQIFFGGDSSSFWEPFSISVISGLTFATLVTLIIVPVIYQQVKKFEAWLNRTVNRNQPSGGNPPSMATSQNGHEDTDGIAASNSPQTDSLSEY